MIIRWIARHSWKLVKWLFVGTALYLVIAVFTSLIPLRGEEPAQVGVQVFVVSNGVHTDICVPVSNSLKDWRNTFSLQEEFPGRTVNHLCFGWGDLGFYVNTPTWSDLSPRTALKAMLLPSQTAMHVTPWSHEPEVHTRCRRLFLSNEQYRRLCAFIEEHIQLDEAGKVSRVGRGYGGGDAFYLANGSYHLFRTCNEWTSEALHEAGVQTGIWSPFAQSVMVHIP